MEGSTLAEAQPSAKATPPERTDANALPTSFTPNDKWITPAGYLLRTDGIYEMVTKKETTAKGETRFVQHPELRTHKPVWLVGRVYDIDTRWVAYTVAAHTSEGNDVERTLAGDQVTNHSKLVQLALYDFPVNSGNSSQVVKYLSAAIAANGKSLPTTHAASKMVWRKMTAGATKPDAFNLGFRLLRAGEPDAMIAPAVHSGIDPMHFERFMPKGEEKQWADAVLPWLKDHHIVATMACAGLASPLCHLFNVDNRIFEMAGNSGLGKTSTAQLAMSLWGNPDAKKLPGWNGTAVGLERTAALHGNCLLIVDENAQHGRGDNDKGDFAKALFAMAEGKSKPRSNEQLGLRTPDVWRMNIITTGEVSGHASTDHGGILARLISFWGSPLGGKNADTGQRIKDTLSTALANHGFAAPAFIRFLLSLDDEQLAALRAEFVEYQKLYVKMVPETADASLAPRWSASYAAMHVAADWLESGYPNHLKEGDLVAHLATSWKEACSKVRNIDPSVNALDRLRGWLMANNHRILSHEGKLPMGSSATEAIAMRMKCGDYAVFPTTLEKSGPIPKSDMAAIIAGWNDLGLLHQDKQGAAKKTVRIGDGTAKCLVFKGELLWPQEPQPVASTADPETPAEAPADAPEEVPTPVVAVGIPTRGEDDGSIEDDVAEWERILDATGL